MKVLLFILLLPFKLVAFVLFCVMFCLQIITQILGGLLALVGLLCVAGGIGMMIYTISKSESIELIIAIALGTVIFSLITVFSSSITLIFEALNGALIKFVVYMPMRSR